MSHLNSVLIFCIVLVTSLFITGTHAATFTIKSNCNFPVWAAAVPGGGRQMNQGDTWTISANPGQAGARIWARTGCTANGANGLSCTTGDCGGVLQCTGYGSPPNTLAEYTLGQGGSRDFFDISLVDGFNVPMTFLPVSNGCTSGPTCRADLIGQCPSQLKAPGGCNNPCTVFKTDQYCCNSGNCGPTMFSQYFKNACPSAYSYPKDDPTSTFTCASGTNYAVTFCP
ncbi:protein P21-like [Silene latifolia]|uniref:protein P21-like n=1 Tax=Silene latifolia TaxID=37657 RepID=UPI003D7736B9